MPGTKEIRNKIKSVQNTRKITKAMEMVAASKMRKAQERMRAARPYGEKIRNIAAHICHANPEYRHPFLVAARHGEARRHHRRHHRQGPVRRPQHQRAAPGAEPVQGVAGRGRGDRRLLRSATRASASCSASARNIVSHVDAARRPAADGQADRPGQGACSTATREDTLRPRCYIVYTRFVNTMKQEPVIEQLLPLSGERLGAPRDGVRGTTSTSPTRGGARPG